MGPSVWNCDTTLYGFGDNTAGPVWRFGLEPAQPPLGSYQYQTNYPVGEELYSPTSASLAGQSVLIWGASRTFGPICGYNIVNMVGFFASAAVMFGFIFALTKKRWIAWLAGFAVSFSPYYQMKVGGHPGYGYQALLIACVWALFNLIKYKRKKDVVILSLLLATSFYFDPYFSLLTTALVVPIVLTWFGLVWYRSKPPRLRSFISAKDIKLLLLSGLLFVVLLTPLVYVIVKNSNQISTSVAALRGNVLFEAKACSNLPYEYALPFVLHPVFSRAIGKEDYTGVIDHLHNGFSCGIGEDTVGVSMAILAVTLLGLIVMTWEKIQKRKLNFDLGYDKKLILYGMLAVLVTALLLGLPPIRMFGIIPTPSYALLEITTTWRTLTRFYVIVNFATITLFTVVLMFALSNLKKYKKIIKIIFVLIILSVFVEYLAFRPFTGNKLSTFDYSKDVPVVYNWLRDQNDIKVVAEYPIERSGGESNAMAFYLSMQVAHKKILFNGNIPISEEEDLRASLKDLSDPQTLPVLRAVGVDAVVIHGLTVSEVENIKGLEILRAEPQSGFNILAFTPLVKNDNTIIARITAEPQVTMLSFEEGFVRNAEIIRSAIDWEYEALNNSLMRVSSMPGSQNIPEVAERQCFAIRLSGELDKSSVNIDADESADTKEFMLGSEYIYVSINAKDSIRITNVDGFNFRIKDLGCPRQ